MLRRVYTNPDGSVRIVIPNERIRKPGESDIEFMDRIAKHTEDRNSALQGLPSVTVDENDIPNTRDKRHAWRLNPQNKVVPDPTIPDPPNPRQSLIDEIDGAPDLAALKSAIIKILK